MKIMCFNNSIISWCLVNEENIIYKDNIIILNKDVILLNLIPLDTNSYSQLESAGKLEDYITITSSPVGSMIVYPTNLDSKMIKCPISMNVNSLQLECEASDDFVSDVLSKLSGIKISKSKIILG